MSFQKRRAIASMLVIAVAATTLTACWDDERDVYALPDWHQCIVDKEDGTIEELPAGSGKIRVEDDAIIWGIPTSQRFINASTTSKRDPGLPQFISGQDATYKPMRMEAQAFLYFNLDMGCEFVTKHMMRNVPRHIAEQKDLVDKFGFNVRTGQEANEYLQASYGEEEAIARIPWFKWFGENIFYVMNEAGVPLMSTYAWEFYQFSFPVNADRDGVLPCLSESEVEYTDPEDPTKTITVTQCDEVEQSAGLAKDLLEPKYGADVTEQLSTKINGGFFCGNLNTYSGAGKEDPCEPIVMDIISIYADEGQFGELIATRRQQIDLRERAEDNLRLAETTRTATEAELAAQSAQDDQQFQLKQQNLADEERIAQLEATNASNLQEIIVQNEGIDPEVFATERQAAIDAAKARSEVETKMLPCTTLGVPVTGFECALILIAYNGGTLPEGYMPSLNDYLSGLSQPQAAEPAPSE